MNADSFMTDEQLARAEQAADWFIRLSVDDVSEADLADWLKWCSDRANALEFRSLCDTWAALDQLRPEAVAILEGRANDTNPSSRVPPRAPVRRSQWLSSSRIRWLAGAAALVVVTISVSWMARDSGWLSPARRDVTSAARNRSTTLSDGSTLTLAPRTRVAVDFTGPTRSLAMSQGEAFFKVHPDKAKPFVVRAGELTVTAVGTAFDVRSEPGRAVVTVQEGVVNVASVGHDTSLSGSWRVSAGYQVVFDTAARDVRLSAVDAMHALDWRDGRLQYFDEPLGAVVSDVNRYSTRPIKVADSRVGQLAFTGTVFVDSIDDWLSSIQSTFPIRAVVTKDQRVLLISDDTETRSPPPAE